MEEFKCESNSDYDMLSNIKNNILNCDFDGKKKVANSIGDFDCRLIPNDSRFLTLTHRGKIEKINDIILLRKEFPLNDEIFNASSSDNNSNDGDEAA